MFDNLKTDDAIAHEGDYLGGSRILDTDAYTLAIDVAYLDVSKGGANSVNVVLKSQDGKLVRQQWWVTSGTAKGCKNYYEKDGKKSYLPGFSAANNFALLAVGEELSTLAERSEEKVLNLYDFEARKEVPTKKKVLTGLLGAEITVGVERQKVDKTAKNDAGAYVPTGETREQNEIVKSFRAKDGLTATEIRAGETEAVFLSKWVDQNKGNIRDLSTGEAAVEAGAQAGAPAAVTETKSLF